MPQILPSLLQNRPKPNHPFLLLQSSVAQSSLPVLRHLLHSQLEHGLVILICCLHAPTTILSKDDLSSENLHILDWTSFVPGFQKLDLDARIVQMKKLVSEARGPISLAVDSADTLNADLGSIAATYKFLLMALMLLKTRTAPSRLICHVNCPSELVHVLTQIAFSSSLVQIVAHPPVLLTHIAQVYLTPPPPASLPEKFWRVFSPFVEREQDVESLVFGTGAEGGGGGGSSDEFVVELLVRSGGEGKRKNVERSIEGWSKAKDGPCELSDLGALKDVWTRPRAVTDVKEASIDPTQGLPFNLSLTPAQVESRSQVPLPYAYDGHLRVEKPVPLSGQILYDPDSADDIDEEDPDEDLDI